MLHAAVVKNACCNHHVLRCPVHTVPVARSPIVLISHSGGAYIWIHRQLVTLTCVRSPHGEIHKDKMTTHEWVSLLEVGWFFPNCSLTCKKIDCLWMDHSPVDWGISRTVSYTGDRLMCGLPSIKVLSNLVYFLSKLYVSLVQSRATSELKAEWPSMTGVWFKLSRRFKAMVL